MYAMWYVVFGALGLLALSVPGLIVFGKLKDKYWRSRWDSDKNVKKYDRYDNLKFTAGGVAVLAGIIAFVSIIVSIMNPICAAHEIRDYEYQYEMCEVLIEDGNLEQNILVGNIAKEANIWLANARANKERWGEWSKYYDCDLDSLKYIGEK